MNPRLRGLALKEDVQQFLVNPVSRVERARFERLNREAYTDGYTGNPRSMASVMVNREEHTVSVPPGFRLFTTCDSPGRPDTFFIRNP